MKTLLENYIKRSDEYIDICRGTSLDNYDKDAAKALDEAGKALRKAAKEKGLDLQQLKSHMIKFISSNVRSTSINKNVAEINKDRREHNIRILETFLGIK
ncbi:hypothetical protein KNT62_gp071 [Escherichia phage phiC120]|uniref:Uncharacterized protein n=2 Tax=Mosigvirus TaxID=1913652 RepID=A0A3G3MD27_9CAUD|nr:hypothetical protein KNT62_gp071 [Escherichia phage phiC120]ARM70778.1 hypothetical protein phiC120_c72 [Escherichia phage phiC120]AYR04137.1 hypothetical protein [Escherichia phage OLB35]EHH5496132.1 hypothetical protein [Escherichia coli]ELV3995583.1 hypothetical protein [Escherichia coli]